MYKEKSMKYRHISVMLNEILEFLEPASGKFYIDGTLGGGGYTFALSKIVGDKGKVISFDMDKLAIENSAKKIKKDNITNIELIHDNFKNLHRIFEKIPEKEFTGVDGVVFDLGLSSAQLEDQHRGFSFQLDAPLDMSFEGESEEEESKTKTIINKYNQSELEKILREYGEEKWARRISLAIVKAREEREITTTKELLDILQSAMPARPYKNKRIHFATKTFQALRIATNEELNNISEALPKAVSLMKSGGRLVVVSFHSLEDRIVKRYIKKESRDCICPPAAPVCVCGHKATLKQITKKVLKPSEAEIKNNPRARSALLRVAEKI